jgi:tetratricopeptide (TPR) repeat protein
MRNLCRAFLFSRWSTAAGLAALAFILVFSLSQRWSRHRLPRAYRVGEKAIAGQSPERARAELEAYLTEHPDDWYALRLYGVILVNLGEKEEGIEFLVKSLRLNPHQPSVADYLRTVGREPVALPCPESASPEHSSPSLPSHDPQPSEASISSPT